MQMSRDYVVPVGICFVHDAAAQRNIPGVVDEDVDSPEFRFHGFEGWGKIVPPGKIECHGRTRNASFSKLLQDSVVLGFGSAQHCNSGTRPNARPRAP